MRARGVVGLLDGALSEGEGDGGEGGDCPDGVGKAKRIMWNLRRSSGHGMRSAFDKCRPLDADQRSGLDLSLRKVGRLHLMLDGVYKGVRRLEDVRLFSTFFFVRVLSKKKHA